MRSLARLLLLAAALAGPAIADAQLFRAYLSTSGNDANPCTLPAPCRLLPAALNAVAPRGEIWILDSANYNTSTVTIGKSVTVLAIPGAIGSLLAQGGTPAVQVSAAGVEAEFRNMSFTQLATDATLNQGIRVTAASSVTVSASSFRGLRSSGISLQGGARARIHETSFHDVTTGIFLSDNARATVSRSQFFGGGTGVSLSNNTDNDVLATVTDSIFSGNVRGVWTNTYAAYQRARATVVRSTFENNTTALQVSVAGNTEDNAIRISASTLVGNGRAWNHNSVNPAILSTGDNIIGENDASSIGAITAVSTQ